MKNRQWKMNNLVVISYEPTVMINIYMVGKTMTTTRKSKPKNPWKRILSNAVGAQKGWNTWHQSLGVNRPVKTFTCTEEDIERIYHEQNGHSRWLKLPIDPMDVFRRHYPLSPSLDRLDNNKDYTPDNICISTRFENYGFNRATDDIKQECIVKLKEQMGKKDGE